ncbi:MAG: Na(+)-translocating NADH-quinone reductase subunit A [Crocinitomicaceae bacterium]
MSNTISIRKGLDIRLVGEATKEIREVSVTGIVAVSPLDFHGLIPKMVVKEGDTVSVGDILFFNKKKESIKFVSPVSGTVQQIVRGEKRRITNIIIATDSKQTAKKFDLKKIPEYSSEEIKSLLLEAGFWSSMKQRPLDIIADPDNEAKGLFVSSFDSAPLAPDYDFVLNEDMEALQVGFEALNILMDGKVHLSSKPNSVFSKLNAVTHHTFEGVHPVGNVGTQIHHIDPVNKGEFVWTLNIQEVAAIGKFLNTGTVDPTRKIALTGSEIHTTTYLKIVKGTPISRLVDNTIEGENVRYISGNVLTGDKKELTDYIGHYANQITVIPEGDEYKFFLSTGWLGHGFDKFSNSRLFPTFLLPKSKKFRLDTNTNGEERAFVVTGELERVFPFDILPVQLTKAAITEDIDSMENLGIYEVAPEDFALCEYVCTTKINIQDKIRQGLDLIASECM